MPQSGIPATYISDTEFKLDDDWTGQFVEERRVYLQHGSAPDEVSEVVSASYDSGNNETTITVEDSGAIDSSLLNVWYGAISTGDNGSLPVHTHEDDDQGGPLSHNDMGDISSNDHHEQPTGDLAWKDKIDETLVDSSSAPTSGCAMVSNNQDGTFWQQVQGGQIIQGSVEFDTYTIKGTIDSENLDEESSDLSWSYVDSSRPVSTQSQIDLPGVWDSRNGNYYDDTGADPVNNQDGAWNEIFPIEIPTDTAKTIIEGYGRVGHFHDNNNEEEDWFIRVVLDWNNDKIFGVGTVNIRGDWGSNTGCVIQENISTPNGSNGFHEFEAHNTDIDNHINSEIKIDYGNREILALPIMNQQNDLHGNPEDMQYDITNYNDPQAKNDGLSIPKIRRFDNTRYQLDSNFDYIVNQNVNYLKTIFTGGGGTAGDGGGGPGTTIIKYLDAEESDQFTLRIGDIEKPTIFSDPSNKPNDLIFSIEDEITFPYDIHNIKTFYSFRWDSIKNISLDSDNIDNDWFRDNDWSAEIEIKPHKLYGDDTLFHLNADANIYVRTYDSGETIKVSINGAWRIYAEGATLNENQWNHVALVYVNGEGYKLFVNGYLAGNYDNPDGPNDGNKSANAVCSDGGSDRRLGGGDGCEFRRFRVWKGDKSNIFNLQQVADPDTPDASGDYNIWEGEFHPVNNDLIAVGTLGHVDNVHIVNTNTKSIVRTFEVPHGSSNKDAFSLAWSPSGDELVAGSYRHVSIFDTSDSDPNNWTWERNLYQGDYSDNWNWIRSLEWSPTGDYLAMGNDYSDVNIFDTSNWNMIKTFDDASNKIYAVSWSADEDYLAAGGLDTRIRVYSTSDTDPNNWNLNYEEDMTYHIRAIDWHPDATSHEFAFAGNGHDIYIKDVDSGLSNTQTLSNMFIDYVPRGGLQYSKTDHQIIFCDAYEVENRSRVKIYDFNEDEIIGAFTTKDETGDVQFVSENNNDEIAFGHQEIWTIEYEPGVNFPNEDYVFQYIASPGWYGGTLLPINVLNDPHIEFIVGRAGGDSDDGDEELRGGASYWGTSYGAGSGSEGDRVKPGYAPGVIMIEEH